MINLLGKGWELFLESVIIAETISDFPKMKKLKGSKNSFRIRIGDYRIGLILEKKNAVFAAFDHRSDIYKYFP